MLLKGKGIRFSSSFKKFLPLNWLRAAGAAEGFAI
jgi:hypothetical protein